MNHYNHFNYLMDTLDILNLKMPYYSNEEVESILYLLDQFIFNEHKSSIEKLHKAHLEKGKILLKLKDYYGSKKEFDKAISLLPDNYCQYLYRGCSRFHLEEFDSAAQDFMHGIYINPFDPKPFLLRGKLEMKMNHFLDAINTFNLLINKFFYDDLVLSQAINHKLKAQELSSQARRISINY